MEDLSSLEKKTLKVSRGVTYTYYVSPAKGSKQTVILFHGWPDTARLWAGIINNYLAPNGYGVIAPDCLGYGGTSKPTDIESYAWPKQTADVIDILDAENVSQVVSLGHDWGCCLAQRLYNFYPARVCGLVLVNVAYIVPKGDFDLESFNKATKEAFGHGSYEYWHFFTADDAADIMNRNPESVYTVAFGDPETWLDNWCSPGGMRSYVSSGRTQPTLPFATAEHKADFMSRFGSGSEGFAAPSCWYKAFVSPVQKDADSALSEDAKRVSVPVLFWGAERDFVCRHKFIQGAIDQGLLPDVTRTVRDGGHWALLERPAEFGRDVLGWLQQRFDS